MNQFVIWSLEELNKNGFEITLLCDMDEKFIKSMPAYVNCINVPMTRGIDFIGSIMAIMRMYRIFKKEKFNLVQYSTPNASMYASIASWLARVPIRLYCQWGIIYVGMSGIKRRIFKAIEKLVCSFSTDIQPDSHGNLNFSRVEKLYSEERSRVVWNGSASGLDLDKFDYLKKEKFNSEIRKKYKIPSDAVVIGFLGRVGKEKGFDELITAFISIKEKYKNVKLLFVGPNEKPKTVSPNLLKWFENSSDVIKIGWTDQTEKYLSAMDMFVFPSYREGFGNVVIEAEAMAIPVIATDIPGPQNGLVDGVTGYLVPKQTVNPLIEKIEELISNKLLREQMGQSGRKYVKENFDNQILLKHIIENRNWLFERNSPSHIKYGK
ncbi:glycosyltransferase involved in cell wall biosynthesis [Bacillus niacini]|uniref:Glycosyltransferase involved in cell wall biosynthesis n=1 Tax=Neobacillus niacini TaxID=86668 RepID=A0A852T8U1_9BACI|nr:glycosyltransferase family 4 protein [Neobacillus niacini]NYE03854.1 glycosyltransferase involved in cell wall biosynthesis [Neobacillus niacini]